MLLRQNDEGVDAFDLLPDYCDHVSDSVSDHWYGWDHVGTWLFAVIAGGV